jgi:hypothetical protein
MGSGSVNSAIFSIGASTRNRRQSFQARSNPAKCGCCYVSEALWLMARARKRAANSLRLAEGVGFEPTREQNPLPVFKTGALNRSATLPTLENQAFGIYRGRTIWQLLLPRTQVGAKQNDNDCAACAHTVWINYPPNTRSKVRTEEVIGWCLGATHAPRRRPLHRRRTLPRVSTPRPCRRGN